MITLQIPTDSMRDAVRDALLDMSDAELRTLLTEVQQGRTGSTPAPAATAKPAELVRPAAATTAAPARTPSAPKALDYSQATPIRASAVIVAPARSGKHEKFANQPIQFTGYRDVRGPKGGAYAILDIQIGAHGLVGSGVVQMSLKDFTKMESGELIDVFATLVHTDDRTSIGTVGEYRSL